MLRLLKCVILSSFAGLCLFIIVCCVYTVLSKKELSIKYNFLWRLFNRFILDRLNRVNNNSCFGFTLFCGRQGGGKTYSAIEYIYRMARKHHSLIITNTPLNCPAGINYIYCNDINSLNYYLVGNKDRSYIIFLDEIQALFDSKNFDEEFYRMFCQLRKRNILVVGTAQVFERCALKLREQVNHLYYCRTFLGCLTRVKEYYPVLNSSGKLSTTNTFGLNKYFLVQCDDIRNMYDTYYKI